MGRALLIIGWMSTVGFVATGVVGFGTEPGEALGLHMLLGLASSLLMLFSHCWIMFYLIGTGKAIKVAVTEHDLEGDAIQKTKDFKNESYPWMMLAMGLAMTTFIIGGGVDTKVISPLIHSGLYMLTILAQVKTLVIEHQVLRRNQLLMADVSQRITA